MKKTIIINSGALDITMIINKSGIFKLKGNRKIERIVAQQNKISLEFYHSFQLKFKA